jgi:hypothetical protein
MVYNLKYPVPLSDWSGWILKTNFNNVLIYLLYNKDKQLNDTKKVFRVDLMYDFFKNTKSIKQWKVLEIVPFRKRI